jgi:pimeloyl-ACP methyl ester carboxylesterase
MAVSPQHFTDIDGLRVHFRQRGSGEPLVLLHGWGGSSLSFVSVASRLERQFRVLAPDLPGFGFSDTPPMAWGAADYAEAVAELMAAAGIESANVLGHSRGGVIATALAASRPELVKRLVLVAAPVVRLPAETAVSGRSKAYGRVKVLANLLPSFKERILNWGRMKYGSEDYRNAGPELRPTLVRLLSEDWRDALLSVRSPALLIYGKNDEDVRLAVAHAAIESLPADARLVVMPTGHFPFMDDAEAFLETVTGFLAPAEATTDV